MYISLGDTVVRSGDVVGIFDLDKTSVGRDTREFLKKAEQRGGVTAPCTDIPVSFAVLENGGVILSSLSPKTVKKNHS